jgi:DNA mismatch endonuclease, patch repair protein
MDRLSKAKRSWNMSRIRSRDTGPEKLLRSLLHRGGFRFRIHSTQIFGHPDIILNRYRTVIFVHGCFWHRHPGCKYAYSPKTRVEFWTRKFEANAKRDLDVRGRLEREGWKVLVVWECELARDAEAVVQSLNTLLRSETNDSTIGRRPE